MLCFDPTRGIDIRTKNQIYVLLRDLAEAGAAILLYTSELKEIQLACDRVIVIFGGEVVAEMSAGGRRRGRAPARRAQPQAGAPSCPRRWLRRPGDAAAVAAAIEATAATTGAVPDDRAMSASAARPQRRGRNPLDAVSSVVARQRVDTGPAGVPRSSSLVFTKHRQPELRPREPPAPATSVAAAGARGGGPGRVVISGGIDLSVGSQMALTSCVAATFMKANPGEVGVVRRSSVRACCSGCSSARSTECSWSSRGCPTSS